MNDRRNRKGKYNKKRQGSLSMFLVLIVLCCVGGIYFLIEKSHSTIPEPALVTVDQDETGQTQSEETEAETEMETETEALDELTVSLTKMVSDYPEVQTILDNRDEYPEEILNMLASNGETLNFVLNYPEKKGTHCEVEILNDFEYGTIPQLFQWDERWGYQNYGSAVIAVTGCGPTALAMVAAGLTGDASITPAKVADYSEENNYYVMGQGTSWTLMYEGCYEFGVAGIELQLMESTIRDELLMGHPIICSMGPGDFTSDGHFIVLTDWTEEGIKINDPNSREKSEKLWSYETLEGQILNLWSYYAIY